MTKITTANSSRLMVTIGLCFMVALMEGLDLQAAGIAAVGMAQAFALDKMQMGWIFSAGILGLLPGALVGGMLADRHGRKRILLSSVLLFGLFSLATAVAQASRRCCWRACSPASGWGGIAEPDCLNLGSRWPTLSRRR